MRLGANISDAGELEGLSLGAQHLQDWQKRAIAKEIAAGTDTKEICNDWEISTSCVSTIRDTQRQLIEAESEKYLEALPDAVRVNVRHIMGIRDGSISPESNPLQYKEGMRCVENMLKATGIVPSNSRSIQIQALFLDKSKSVLSKEVQEALKSLIPDRAIDDIPADEIIIDVDVEPTDTT